MTTTAIAEQHSAIADAVAALLRQARKNKQMTQADLARRTGGAISKAALANYEAGYRSLRIETFCTIAEALGEDPGVILSAAERAVGHGVDAETRPVTVDIDAIWTSTDARLAPVRRWFAMRLRADHARTTARTVTLDYAAIAALAELVGVTPAECRAILVGAGGKSPSGRRPRTTSSPHLAAG